MNSEQNDPHLSRLFNNRRERDERLTPAFNQLWRRAVKASQEPRRQQTLKKKLVLASGLAALLVMLLWPVFGPQVPKSTHEPRLSEWTAPTDFLLRTPGSDLLDHIPEIPSPRTRAAVESLRQGSQRNIR